MSERIGRVSNPISKGGVSKVQQSGGAQASPQYIVDMMLSKKVPLPEGKRLPQYGDFTSPAFTDYHFYLEQVREVEQTFLKVPSTVRDFYQNDPARFAAGLDEPSHQPFLAKHGIKTVLNPSKEPPKEVPQPNPTPKPDDEANPHKASPEA